MPILNPGAFNEKNSSKPLSSQPAQTTVTPFVEKRGRQREMFQLKAKFHQEIIDRIDVGLLVKFENEVAKKEVSKLVGQLVDEATLPLSLIEKQQIIREVVDEVFGLGPLEPLLADSSIDEILVNNYKSVYVERRGLLEAVEIHFKDNTHLRHIINRIVSRVGRRIDESSPMVDARLPDGSRVNAIIPPLALDGPALSIRRFKAIPFTAQQLIQAGSFSNDVDHFLALAIASRSNVIVSGGTGSGKTTLMNVFSSYISPAERIVTIEDAAEIQLKQPHVVRLETRPNNMEGKGGVTQRELFRNCLRMRPDRIIVGEVRGAEALDMLQAMNTGHDGSLTTIHANTPRDAISRIETMVLMNTSNIEQKAVTRQIASAVHMIVQVKRYSDGVRRIESIQEITGMENGMITMQEIVSFDARGMSKEGKIMGVFKFHPYKPRVLERAKAMGIDLGKYHFKAPD